MKYVELGKQRFMGLTFSPDGRYLVSLHPKGILRFWSLPDYTEQLFVQLVGNRELVYIQERVFRMTLFDRFLLVPQRFFDLGEAWDVLRTSGGGSKARAFGRLVDLQSGEFGIRAWIAARSELVAARPAERYISGPRRQVSFYQSDGRRQRSYSIRTAFGEGWFSDLAASPDGQILAGCDSEKGIVLLRLDQMGEYEQDGKPARLPHTDEVRRVCFSPTGRFLASAAGRSVWLWDLSDFLAGGSAWVPNEMAEPAGPFGAPVRFPAFRTYIEWLTFHPRGHLFAAGGYDGEVRLYETASRKEVMRLPLELGEIRGLAFAPDGMTAVAAGYRKRLAVWDVD
jgi:WD40 repeat protein